MTRVLIASDFHVGNLAAILANDSADPRVSIVDTPFGQPWQLLADESAPCWSEPVDCAVVWTQPHGVIASFARALEFEPVDREEVLREVDGFAALIRGCAARARSILVPTWVLPAWERGWGLLDMRPGTGIADLLARMNARLAERLDEALSAGQASSIYVFDAARWITQAGTRAFAPKAWYMGKIPFGTDVFRSAAADIKAALRAIAGDARKLIVLDLDDTLWGGIVGETGWENLVLGGHDSEGEARVDFQRALKGLARRGVLLGLVSKNEENVALTAIREHPEMVLRTGDFSGWRINWQDKATNISELAAELNLGLQSVVFIDDNPAERARVREALPEVLVPEWPADCALFRRALLELTCFDVAHVTSEDRQRTALYAADRERRQTRATVGSLDDWLGTLEMELEIEPLSEANLARATQLLNKTNQMNLRTRRMTAAELMEWSCADGHALWTVKVRDRFGDLGLTGLISVVDTGDGAMEVADFLLSCRIMGRRIEEAMFAIIDRYARDRGTAVVNIHYAPTAKNKPFLDFLNRSRLEVGEPERAYLWRTTREYPMPPHLSIRLTPHHAQPSGVGADSTTATSR